MADHLSKSWKTEVLSQAENDVGGGTILFRDVVARWLSSKKTGVKESTFACYTFMVEKHLLPTLGELPVNEIDDSLLAVLLEQKKTAGRLDGGSLSDKTISDMKVILMQIMRYANKMGAIRTVPECPPVTTRRPDVSVLTIQEQTQLERKALQEDSPFSLGILLSLYSGIRIGEVCGLQWQDFDCNNETVTISKTIYRISSPDRLSSAKTKVIVGTPKTDCSQRTIPLPTSVFQYFMERRRPGNFYVITGTSMFMEPRVCLAHYKRLLRRAGINDHTFHTLRHTFATRCVESGVDMKSLSEIMGHSDVKITMQRYVHPSIDAKKSQINKLPCFHGNGQANGAEQEEIA
ncbi:MAG: tyrosine-type recombinase/integrase [Clostridiales bacterium]|nr:tyrosine-type recombinase/integrase [Clostridiales bacterium]